MELLILWKVLCLGVVEGVTEFLPISSTGHLILMGDLLDFNDEKGKVFEIVVQLAAILAVCWEYRAKIRQVVTDLFSQDGPAQVRKEIDGEGRVVNVSRRKSAQRFIANLAIAFLPAAVLGLLFIKSIKAHLFKPVPVALAFIVGGLLILWAERREHRISVQRVEDMTWRDALKIGVAQSLALIPGTSRSGATIIGGLFFGLSRQAATEFSFFLAIPTMFAATFYEMFKNRALFSAADLPMFAVGSLAAFVSAFLAVRGLLRYIARHDFSVFAWYRILFGGVVLVTAYSGMVTWSAA